MKKLSIKTKKILYGFIVILSFAVITIIYLFAKIPDFKIIVIFFSFLCLGFMYPLVRVLDKIREIKNKRKCLMVTSEPYFWDEYKEMLEDNGVVVKIAISIAEVPKLLAKENYNFAVVNNTMFGQVPNVGKYDFWTAGSLFTSKYLEKRKIPYIIISTVDDGPSWAKLPNCLWRGFSIDILPSEMEAILKEKKII